MDWRRATPWAVAATLVFGYMHILDEMWARWDFGGTITSSTQASIQGVLPLALGLWALAWILQENDWGYLVGLVLGLFMTYAGGSHFVGDTAAMTGFQTTVVVLLLVSALATVVACGQILWTDKPWSEGEPART